MTASSAKIPKSHSLPDALRMDSAALVTDQKLGGIALRRLGALMLGVCFACSLGPSSARGDPPPYDEMDAAEPSGSATGAGGQTEVPKVDYAVRFEGVSDPALLSLLEGSSILVRLRDKPPPSIAGLDRRAEEDLAKLRAALNSEGYYDGTVDYDIKEDETPPLVVFEVDPGTRYLLGAYEVSYLDGVPEAPPEADLEQLGLELGAPARGPAIADAGKSLIRILKTRGYPFPKIEDRKAFINRETQRLTVELKVRSGPLARFGPTSLEGPRDVEESYIRGFVTWEEGEPYNIEEVEETANDLRASGLFESAVVQPAESLDSDGELPMTIEVLERDHRSIGFGVAYSTDKGPGGSAFWEHRNLLNSGEKFRASIEANQLEQELNLDFRKPRFLDPEQDLLVNFALANRDTDAFKEQSILGFAGLERVFFDKWTVTGGGSLEFDRVEDSDGRRDFLIFGLPSTASRDASNDLLNPTEGWRLKLAVTPAAVTIDETFPYLATELRGTTYYAVDAEERFVLAGRTRLGSILGVSRDQFPASKRFYAGGGGSIRGYEFQSVGPLDENGDPLGGLSVVELGAELRIRMTDTIGLVPFVEGGTVFDDPIPDFSEDLRFAAGLGLRYFTGIGPLRLDIAFPLNPRDRDDAFQFYISLGQAF